ncbi:hypothetical protein [Dialister sp.]|jgi:hypothetical protein|uniref:hypothetical protein n=1 Tax=Dialister sp. TaxID=1955814 RepID=UPI0025DA4C42|nr:hypothetical protein [Dialister sp.]
MDKLGKKKVSIFLQGGEEGFTIHSDGTEEETKYILLAAACYITGIPAHHVKDAEAFLTVLGREYGEEEKGTICH